MAMTDSCKILAVGGDKLDRLTDLPVNVIHQIQDHMSTEDAAKTSVLSRAWRYVWASNPKLVFGARFCTKRTPSDTIEIISTVLFQHHGAIKTFFLDISIIPSSQHSVIDGWMLFLSRNGLVNLTIQNLIHSNAPYKLPSYVYGMGLERLGLLNCIFRPPCSFRGFHMLKWIHLNRVDFELYVANSSLWMPTLKILCFMHYSGLRFLNIHAPLLLLLFLHSCGTLELSSFMECGKLRTLGFTSQEVSQNRQDKAMNLTNFLSCWHNVSHLILGTYFLKVLASDTRAESHPTRLTNLRSVDFVHYSFDDEDQIFALLRVLRSCPNLNILQFFTSKGKKGDMEVDVNYFEEADCAEPGFNNLQTLRISKFYGSTTELRFVRFILGSAPLLHKAFILVDSSINESQSLKISKELMRFPRASPKTEVVFEPWSKKDTILVLDC